MSAFLVIPYGDGVLPKKVVGGKDAVEAGHVDPWFRHQGGEAGDEVQGFEDDVGGAVVVRCLERITHSPDGPGPTGQ